MSSDVQNYSGDEGAEYNSPYRKNPPRVRKKNRLYGDEYYEPPTNYKPRILHSPRPSIQSEEMTPKVRKPAKLHKSLIGHMPWRTQMHHPERRMAQTNAVRLRNVLKLPKAHKWVFYEWFYSNLDRPLLLGENDFRICLRESFPNVKTRRLSRAHWSLLRRLMGKPRRCSTAFFDEERRSLNEKREKIRTLQATRSVQLEFLRDLPDDMHVPMPLIIGTKITARVRYPTDGLYTGKVDAIDALRHCYRVTFDKPALGTRSIPDYEVLSILPQETIPLSAYKTQHKASRNLFMSPARLLAQSALQGKRHHMHHHKFGPGLGQGGGGGSGDLTVHDCPLCQSEAAAAASSGGTITGSPSARAPNFMAANNNNNALATPLKLPAISSGDVAASMGSAALSLNESSSGGRLLLNEADIYGGYPMKFLVMVTKLSKILEVKKRCVDELQDLNDEAERKISNKAELSLEFQHTYLTLVMHLERLNKELNQYLVHVLQYANEIAQEHGVAPLEQAADFKQRCDEDAYEIVTRIKSMQAQKFRNLKTVDLITKLVSLLVQIRSLSEHEESTYDCSSIQESLHELKSSIHSSNVHVFENSVEISVHHTLSGLCTLSNLNSFLYTHPNHFHYL
ncbi:Protein lin-9 isoform 1 [Schistosoma japonicum]|uniref:Lin-9 homolog n=3 Tax=Schistosoma japonicum TaxID=6182 RepID=C1L4U1_SCHJA|nr:Protein lin-9 like [Schistosoma japonicum]TNN06178.1 Protein lin-9 isoform 1 [Schistosoma japonicum]CAX69719.1 Lin-9 homolog [Schistosoma japonicum]